MVPAWVPCVAPHGAEMERTVATVEELTAQVEELTRERDEWKGHARKHEDRAKDSAEKLTVAESQIADLTAQVEGLPDVDAKVAEAVDAANAAATDALRTALIAAHGLDETAAGLLTATDAAALAKQASTVAALRGTAPSAPREGYTPGGVDKNAELGSFLDDLVSASE